MTIVGDELGVGVGLDPGVVSGAPGYPAFYEVEVTNTGDVEDTYDLTVEVPGGWSYKLTDGGTSIPEITLPPLVLNTTSLQLVVTPAAGASPGEYAISVTATSQTDEGTQHTAAATLSVLPYGVNVELTPESTTMDPLGTHTWDLLVTNTGAQGDTFDLVAEGAISSQDGAAFSPSEVTLQAGDSAVVQLTAGPLPSAPLERDSFTVVARSQGDSGVLDYDTAEVTFEGVGSAEMMLLPQEQTVEDTLQATFVVMISNTGNADDVYVLSGSAVPALELEFEPISVYLERDAVTSVVLTATAATEGDYTITARATSASSGAVYSDTSLLTVITNRPPEVEAGPDQVVGEGDVVDFEGSFVDPDIGDTHIIRWDFGDGGAAGGTLTPTHGYDDDGAYVVTLTVTDAEGEMDRDKLLVRVENVAPLVDAGSDLVSDEGAGVALGASFTDPGVLDTHTIEWQFGDGLVALGTLTPVHAYTQDGVYTATLKVTDNDGGVGVDTVQVAVANVAPAVDAGPDETADEGAEVAFAGSFTDPGVVDTHTIEWDFGDGVTELGTLEPVHAYGDDGLYTVTLTVADDDGGVGVGTAVVTVTNAAPSVTVSVSPTLALPRQEVVFEGAFSDPGYLDTHTIEWDFGDGITMTGLLTVRHAYEVGDVYAATLTVTDDDGGVGQASVVVGVSLELYPIALHVDTIAGAEVGQELDDILNGELGGNFGWLSWAGDPSEPTLAESLTLYGNSGDYVNPNDAQDSVISVGDWVFGAPGVVNSTEVRDALGLLEDYVVTVPVWDVAERSGGDVQYHVVGFAHVQITGYDLAGDNLVSASFWGMTTSPEQ
ncbi:MAG: PKD domain-containing protein [Anaerolineales bacterium]|nr:MAG: PKD domain-containing protein [Anaerolineales bacterium]